MGVEQITAPDAHEILTTAPGSVYLDVRTVREFEQGHPPGAINVPIVFMDPNGGPARPNEQFLDVVRQHIADDAVILVGCQSGVRSQRAADLLAAAGYQDVRNVQGGFGGSRDRTGRVTAPGWRDSGLPVEVGQPAFGSYETLGSKNRP